jgi:hypothetical protein
VSWVCWGSVAQIGCGCVYRALSLLRPPQAGVCSFFWVLEDGGACVDFTNFADGLDRADGPLNYSLALNELGSQSVPVLAQGGSALCWCS